MRFLSTLFIVTIFAFPLSAADEELKKAVALYASFDEWPEADVGSGDPRFWTRLNDAKEKGKFVHTKGFDAMVFGINKKGVQGGCLEAKDVLPENGRIYFPAKGNIGYREGGWSGALSVWINTDPNTLLKTKFCDPIQITQKGANNGGIWFDFNDAKPRDMRHGVFTAVGEGEKPLTEEGDDAPMVRVPRVAFKQGEWRHIVLNWKNLDTGKKDAISQLYIDGKLIGEVKDRAIGMKWDMEKAGIYVAVNYIGLLDELAVFGRALSENEIASLHKTPGLLSGLKKK